MAKTLEDGQHIDLGPHNPIREEVVDVGTLAGVATITTAEIDIAVPGILLTDVLLGVEKPTHQAGLGIAGARIKADAVVAVTFVNPTAGTVTPTADELYLFKYGKG